MSRDFSDFNLGDRPRSEAVNGDRISPVGFGYFISRTARSHENPCSSRNNRKTNVKFFYPFNASLWERVWLIVNCPWLIANGESSIDIWRKPDRWRLGVSRCLRNYPEPIAPVLKELTNLTRSENQSVMMQNAQLGRERLDESFFFPPADSMDSSQDERNILYFKIRYSKLKGSQVKTISFEGRKKDVGSLSFRSNLSSVLWKSRRKIESFLWHKAIIKIKGILSEKEWRTFWHRWCIQ